MNRWVMGQSAGRMLWRGCVVLLILGGGMSAARAEVAINAFFGRWVGAGISESEISANFQTTARDLEVIVTPHAQAGFEITWSTVQRQKGNPDDPTEKVKSTTLQFSPDAGGLWRAGGSDPFAGTPVAWARIDDNSLIVSTFTVTKDGAGETQIYRRTLSGMGMALDYRRVVDGELVRSAKARLSKYAE